MSSGAGSDRDTVVAAYDELEAAFEKVAELSLDAMTNAEQLTLMNRREVLARRLPALDHPVINRLTAEASPTELGGTSWAEVLATGLRISKNEARRRIRCAELFGPRTAMTGEPLEPQLPHVAAAQERGEIGPEHLRIIERFFKELPHHVDYETRDAAEAQLTSLASGFRPEELRQAADRLALVLDQDGEPPNDAERARRRYLHIGRQQSDGMTPIKGLLDPEARATMDAVFAKLAAPGMCNPDDEAPCVDGEATDAAVHGDMRSQGQRNHDALKAMGRCVLASGELGQHKGLPCTIIVSTTLKELEAGSGQAVTAGGTLLPISDVIRMASHSHHYLVIYKDHTQVPLYLGRTKRFASPGQRIVLYAKDRGCTRPGCTVPAYWSEVHHAAADWAKDGQTNIDDLTLACGPDNRLVEEGGWKTRKRKDGRTEWLPPPYLDSGQPRVNDYHHPENYLLPNDDDDP